MCSSWDREFADGVLPGLASAAPLLSVWPLALLSWLASVWVLWGQGQRLYLHIFCVPATSRVLLPVAADLEMHAVHVKGEHAGERGRFLEPGGPWRTFSSTSLFHFFRRRLKPEEVLSFSLAQCFRVSSTQQQQRKIEMHPYSEDVDMRLHA